MSELWLVALAGFCASLVDGALGMGFGPTSSSILLNQGYSPAVVSTTVNLAKVTTGLAAAISHWRFNNIDHRLVLRLAIPGCVGALIGVTVLASVDADVLKPVLAVLLLLVGLRILVRFSRPLPLAPDAPDDTRPTRGASAQVAAPSGVEVAATAGGVTNGLVGAWGPVVTPFLLHKGVPPRFSIGSVNTAEVAVATVSAGSLIASIGGDGLELEVLLAMLVGGLVAAPLAALVIRFIPARDIGLAVAALLLVTNTRELANEAELGDAVWAVYGVIALLVAAAALRPRLAARRDPTLRSNRDTDDAS
jgi:uncharacterized membrane protein YfcA